MRTTWSPLVLFGSDISMLTSGWDWLRATSTTVACRTTLNTWSELTSLQHTHSKWRRSNSSVIKRSEIKKNTIPYHTTPQEKRQQQTTIVERRHNKNNISIGSSLCRLWRRPRTTCPVASRPRMKCLVPAIVPTCFTKLHQCFIRQVYKLLVSRFSIKIFRTTFFTQDLKVYVK